MPKFTIDIFEDAANRFETAQAEVLKEWQPSCGCSAPGLRPECHTCSDCHQLRVLTQLRLSPTPEQVFPPALPPDSNHRYPADIRDKALEMYARGCPLSEIQAETGVCGRQTIRNWARKSGIPPRLTIYPTEIRENCLRLYKLGKKPSEIEPLTGVPADTIAGWAHDAGISRNLACSAETKTHCLSLYQQGGTLKEIEILTGVPASAIRRWAVATNISRGSGRPRKYPESVRRQCLLLRQEGKDYREIEVLTGVTPATVRGWVKKSII